MAAYAGQQQETVWGKMFNIAGKAVKYTAIAAVAVGAVLVGGDLIAHAMGSEVGFGDMVQKALSSIGLGDFFGISPVTPPVDGLGAFSANAAGATNQAVGATLTGWAQAVDTGIGKVVDHVAAHGDKYLVGAGAAATGAVVGKYTQKIADERKMAEVLQAKSQGIF